MKSFKDIFTDENMIMPNNFGVNRVQNFNPDRSVSFNLDNASRNFLRINLPFIRIYEPTLKKIAENIIILNRQKHRISNESRILLMNKETYSDNPDSFFYESIHED
ncbi:hypothetical protein A4W74_01340 [Latilactobacillus curvatus]|uniref:hypothetical protein n=1 Tax=Latilactobacillus curvatus TaxID=28038 RepID=UPI0020A38E1B|nr:hypothetical protein [Latilactobacillus curvatus]UTB75428.1 hypothetical protein A4W74_01340 [Latilactobacillus curvatus]